MYQKKIEHNLWVTAAGRYTWSFKFYVQPSMPPNPSFDKLREADSPAKGFLSACCACEMQVVKTHLITFAAIVIEESISQNYGIQTLTTTPVWVVFPQDLCFSFMLLLNNTEGYVSVCLSQGG